MRTLDVEAIYQLVILEMGRAGRKRNVYLTFSSKRNGGQFIVIREGDYRENNIGSDQDYDLIGTYRGDELPRFTKIAGDINAYLQEEAQKEYGVRPELYGLTGGTGEQTA